MNRELKLPPLLGGPVTTKSGERVTIVSTEMRPRYDGDEYTVAGYIGDETDLSYWNKEGISRDTGSDDCLTHAPISGEVWVNVIDYDSFLFCSSKRQAIDCVKSFEDDLLARIRIPFTVLPGRFDDDER